MQYNVVVLLFNRLALVVPHNQNFNYERKAFEHEKKGRNILLSVTMTILQITNIWFPPQCLSAEHRAMCLAESPSPHSGKIFNLTSNLVNCGLVWSSVDWMEHTEIHK